MRPFYFLSAFLVFAIGLAFAGDSPKLSPPPKAVDAANDTARSDDGIFLAPDGGPLANSAAARENDKGKEVCLKLRTYVVNRQERFSDDDRVSRYTDCQPAAKYQVRSTAPQATPESH